ncbi:MAG: hypothetical protein PHO31_01100 [Candidatus Pacebacteria bacterium]|nr:hypothetical protein [Candidatus Paceibacterota bacterium]
MQKSRIKNNLDEKQKRFKYSSAFESAMRELLGDRAYHSADSATNPAFVKKVCQKALNKIRERIDNVVTMDERLRAMLFLEIGYLEKEISKINKENNDWEIISILFHIIARLLGYDWASGKVCREVVYFRNKNQEYQDYLNDFIAAEKREKKYKKRLQEFEYIYLQRCKEVIQLKNKGFHSNQIARIMNMTEYAVNQILKIKLLPEILKLSEQGLSDEEIGKRLNESGFAIRDLKDDALIKARESILRKKLRKEI